MEIKGDSPKAVNEPRKNYILCHVRRVVGRREDEEGEEEIPQTQEEKIEVQEKSSKIPNKKSKELLELNAEGASPLNLS